VVSMAVAGTRAGGRVPRRGTAPPLVSWTGAAAATALLLLTLSCGLLAGCSSSGSSSAESAKASGCEDVAAILSDGPDPGADPIGYAEAQILPLRQMHTSDSSLAAAVSKLADAYQAFYETKGSSSSNDAVNKASARLDSICPGATS
jgi:hypothetical protein